MDGDENYQQKAKNIFNLINKYRINPSLLANHLQNLKNYLDKSTNVLSEPNKIQIQMVEGEEVFNEAISFLKKLPSLPVLKWDNNLAASAQEHVNDIGPKGLLLYQSSDGTEPEERIGKYGKFVESLGENIDFGPNDEMGVIVSLTLDDGEQQRPHRDNLFKTDYKKVGIACGPHKTEFQMCVMDFAFDFLPKNNNVNVNIGSNANNNRSFNNNLNNDVNDNPVVNLNLDENNNNNNNYVENYNNEKSSPFVKLSLDKDDLKNYKGLDEKMKQKLIDEYSGKKNIANNNNNNNNNIKNSEMEDEINNLTNEVKNLNFQKKIVSKKVEITTKILYTFEDGSTKQIEEKITHNF